MTSGTNSGRVLSEGLTMTGLALMLFMMVVATPVIVSLALHQTKQDIDDKHKK